VGEQDLSIVFAADDCGVGITLVEHMFEFKLLESAVGISGVRATLDFGSKTIECIRYREPHSARIARDSEVIYLDENRLTPSCDLRRVVLSQLSVCRLPARVDFRRKMRPIAFVQPAAFADINPSSQ